MNDWEAQLKADSLPWLLEPENPAVRYLSLTHLLDPPEDGPQVVKPRSAIPRSKDVQAVFARQDPAGWWDAPERATGIKRASGQLLILSRLGVPSDDRTRRGCEFVLSKPWLPSRRLVCIVPCYTANYLRFLAYFGYGDDPRVDQGWRAMVERLEQDDGLICWFQKQRPCRWLAVKALWAFAAAPADRDVRAVIARTAEALLCHDFDFPCEEARWVRFGFPCTSSPTYWTRWRRWPPLATRETRAFGRWPSTLRTNSRMKVAGSRRAAPPPCASSARSGPASGSHSKPCAC
jgi:hypothetical protein